MPTSSQSQILSVVDNQFLHQQQASGQDESTAKSSNHLSVNQTPTSGIKRRPSKDDRRSSIGKKDELPVPSNLSVPRRNSSKTNDGVSASRTSQRNDILHIPVVGLATVTNNKSRRSLESSEYQHNDNQVEMEYKLNQWKPNHIQIDHNSSLSDLENLKDDDDDDDDEAENHTNERRATLLNEYGRRLLILGTIRPSKTFYKDLPESDVEYLMEYFRRMRNTNKKLTSEEINQDLKSKFSEYKPKIFFDSACVTKSQVNNIEKLIEPYVEKIRAHQAELIRLDNPFRFVIRSTDNDTTLITIPREYNDCLLTLITRADPLRKSNLITEIIPNKLLEDMKDVSLDISYFPGGVNYDVPRDEIDENGQMQLETYQKLKKRLNNRKIWYFNEPPMKKPNALIAILPPNLPTIIDHKRLLDCLCERLKTTSSDENFDIEQRILSIEFIPLSCILDSYDISNQFIIDCDTIETKRKLLDKPLKFQLNKQSITVELQSYDENIQREYDKSVKAEKYRELLKNHDEAVKRASKK